MTNKNEIQHDETGIQYTENELRQRIVQALGNPVEIEIGDIDDARMEEFYETRNFGLLKLFAFVSEKEITGKK